VATVGEAVEASAAGFARLPWAELSGGGEATLAASGASVRCLLGPDGSDAAGDRDLVAVVGRAY
jgi:prolyl-tRNA synthetase